MQLGTQEGAPSCLASVSPSLLSCMDTSRPHSPFKSEEEAEAQRRKEQGQSWLLLPRSLLLATPSGSQGKEPLGTQCSG
jgi:hypothetical protein